MCREWETSECSALWVSVSHCWSQDLEMYAEEGRKDWKRDCKYYGWSFPLVSRRHNFVVDSLVFWMVKHHRCYTRYLNFILLPSPNLQMKGMISGKTCFSYTTWQMPIWIHIDYDNIHKICTNRSQTQSQHRWMEVGTNAYIYPRGCPWWVDAGRVKFSFLE